MKTRRTIELNVETRTVSVLRRVVGPAFHWCALCRGHVMMISPERAAAQAGVYVRTIYSGVEAGQIHFLETPEGALLVCADSLEAVAQPGRA